MSHMSTNRMGRPIEMPESWAVLAAAVGGVAALADRLGVTTMTVWRWSSGRKIPGPARIALNTIAAECGVKSPVESS